MQDPEKTNDVIRLLNSFSHSALTENWAEQSAIVHFDKNQILQIEIPFAANDLVTCLDAWLSDQRLECQWHIQVSPKQLEAHNQSNIRGIKNVIAVTSAKGGVGKSTTAVNLALALKQSGARVGLLDADIYGPSVPIMLGTQHANLEVRDGKWMQPVEAYGLYTHSIGYLIESDDAAIWRGPMASKALGQLLNETEWPDLDYLVIDMPPGTGDIQLTLAQQIPVTGALIVTTPQDLALADARKGVTMFEKVDVSVIGLVENMSFHICSQCGHHEFIFGTGGAEKLAKDFNLALLGQIPLHISVREDIDAGKPTVEARPESEHAGYYLALAERVASRLFWTGKPTEQPISFKLVD